MEMRFKNKSYYYVDSGTLKEHYESTVIDSSRVIEHSALYNTTTKYGNVRNVISSASVSDDFDCLVYFSADGVPGFKQSSRDFVPDDRSIQTTLYVYNQVSGTYKVGDDVSVHCDYRLKAKDFLFDRRVYKDNKLFYRYVNKDQSNYTLLATDIKDNLTNYNKLPWNIQNISWLKVVSTMLGWIPMPTIR
ncbi:unnamed protein product [Oppiella nova]|uniref:Uncharacterized protein n=1 Tax=Oppiella nova TaxID=334625 RepID=A0A7R9M5G2_9ACAR|nr:unnamed protein product [Oppiella nova]CAG2170595.1 unnamed protein product [Oppiella nova]